MVKTRLSQDLPASAVTALYRCLLEDSVALARSLSSVSVAVMCPGEDVDELTHFLGNVVRVIPQMGSGLAAGLTSVFTHFEANENHHVIAFNSDSPHLPASVLENAFQVLSMRDMVIGPTRDGGYYLVGAKSAHATLFENDGLGTRSALERLMARTRDLNLCTGFTEAFYDIDVADDLIRLARELQLAPAKAPRTAVWLSEWTQIVPRLRQSAGEV
jgi:hypothetical protein